jgi:general secretion pathway protein J
MSVAAPSRKSSGFTLLEVLVAIFIFAIVLSAVYGAYITAITAADTTELQADINNKARTALERMASDLGGVYLGADGSLNGRKKEIGGNRADTLAFTSTAHLLFSKKEPPAGFGMIRYSVQQDTDSKLLQLYRADLPFRPGYLEQAVSQEKGYLLCDGLHTVRFTYYDQAGNEVDDWQIDEDADQAAAKEKGRPAMIEVMLRFAGGEGREDLIFKTAVALPILQKQVSR